MAGASRPQRGPMAIASVTTSRRSSESDSGGACVVYAVIAAGSALTVGPVRRGAHIADGGAE